MSQNNLKTVVEVLNDLKDQGYTKDFMYTNDSIKVINNEKSFKANEFTVKDEFRFEGESDPADSSILYAIETNDGTKGTILNAFGADTHLELSELIKLSEMNKS